MTDVAPARRPWPVRRLGGPGLALMVLKTLTALGLSWLVGGCAWRQVSVEPALRPEPVWLLGELHDSPHAHRARFRDLEQRVTAGWRPTLVMEQFDREQQPDLDAALGRAGP